MSMERVFEILEQLRREKVSAGDCQYSTPAACLADEALSLLHECVADPRPRVVVNCLHPNVQTVALPTVGKKQDWCPDCQWRGKLEVAGNEPIGG